MTDSKVVETRTIETAIAGDCFIYDGKQFVHCLPDMLSFIKLQRELAEANRKLAMFEGATYRIKSTEEAADAFWKYWRENGETHKHGYYESTWGAINAALKVSGVVIAARPQGDV